MGVFDKDVAKRLLFIIDDCFKAVHVPFFLMQGTALGAYRDKDFVPTEKDVDVGVNIADLFEAIQKGLLYELVSRRVGVTTWNRHHHSMCHTIVCNYYGIKADIVGWYVAHTLPRARFAMAPTDVEPHYCIVHEASTLENLKKIEFLGRQFNVPADTEKYLEAEYGKEWRIPKEDHVSRTRVYGYKEFPIIA